MGDLNFKTYHGNEISTVFPQLGNLRIKVFKDWPYLYEGNLEYEINYLKTYANSPKSLLFTVLEGNEMVGATTCIPLLDETEEVRAPFMEAGMDLASIFYFGESILLPQYRGLGLGHRFFDEREAHARSFGSFIHTCFCGVVRPVDHPARPAQFKPLDEFWRKRGYEPKPELQSQFEWLDIGETAPTKKPMLYWMRKL